jgi:hypothetical protein
LLNNFAYLFGPENLDKSKRKDDDYSAKVVYDAHCPPAKEIKKSQTGLSFIVVSILLLFYPFLIFTTIQKKALFLALQPYYKPGGISGTLYSQDLGYEAEIEYLSGFFCR